MVIRIALRALLVGCLGLGLVPVSGGQASDKAPEDPAFVSWMEPENPDDQTILNYWERAKIDQLDARGLVDLGTMLFHRGFPEDAIRMYQRALDVDADLYEPWFRIGFVKHRQGEVDAARHAYKKCLKRRPGHGWCNFYLGLLEEQTGHPAKALEHYRLAFTHAPELADPASNPEILSSELSLGAVLVRNEEERFSTVSPMSYLRPVQVNRVRSQYAPTPTPTPVSEVQSTAGATAPAASASGIQGSPLAPQPKQRRRPKVQRTPPADTPFGVPMPQRPTPAMPTPTPQP